MPFESLEPELAAQLKAICEAQMSGQFDPRMTFLPGKGLTGRSRTTKGEVMILPNLERADLRNLATHDYVSLATPRNHWFVAATAKALSEFTEDED
jgi:hypothetical protein